MHSTSRSRVVILGGGFAGLACARTLSPRRFDVTLVDRRPNFEFLPNIHELLSGVKTPDSLRLGLASSVSRLGHRYRRATVLAIDADAHQVLMAQDRRLTYDMLVVAIGGVDATYGVKGVTEHALPFKSVRQCARIGSRLDSLGRRRKGADVVIVGGGLEGVEALGEILRRYSESGLRISLLEAQERLLPETPPALDAYLRELCAGLPVDLRTGVKVTGVGKDAVRLAGGESLASDLTIWTGGPAPPPLLAEAGLADAGQWATVDSGLRSRFQRDVFIAGDAAELPRPQARQAYHALDMGECVGRNIDRISRGREAVAYRPSPKPMLVSFGAMGCMLVAGDLVLAGPALAAGKEAVYALSMARFDAAALPQRALNLLRRGNRAGQKLLWPVLTSCEALRRQGELKILSI